MPFVIRPARTGDGSAIARIHNQGIASRLATFDVVHKTADDREAWIAAHGREFPILVAEAADAHIVGWSAISQFSARDCYGGIGYFSVYVDQDARRAGCGRSLVEALATEARSRSYWKLVSGIFASNLASRQLCAACGFREVGVYERHAMLGGRWIDVVMVERLLV